MSNVESMIERRSIERFDISLPVQLEAGDQVCHDISTLNISSKGALLSTGAPLSLGTEIALSVFLPSGKSTIKNVKTIIKTSGRVVRLDQAGVAVLFDKDSKISSLSQCKQ